MGDSSFRERVVTIYCDAIFHKKPEIVAKITHVQENDDTAHWIYIAPEHRDRYGVKVQHLLDDDLMGHVSDPNFFGLPSDHPRYLDQFEYGGKARNRLYFHCPKCPAGDEVVLRVERITRGARHLFGAPILDRLFSAGLERMSLRLLSHAVSYGAEIDLQMMLGRA